MRKCDFCDAPNPDERIECRSCGNPVRRPEPPSLLTENRDGASAYFHIDRQQLADSPEEERAVLARARAEIQAEARQRKWWWNRLRERNA